MCRWLSYDGPEIYLDELLYAPNHSLIEQSLNATEAKTRTNGDGFGIGWFGTRPIPGVYHEILPAWNDTNLRNIAEQVRSEKFFAHVRASTGTATSRANCHPFKHGQWLFMHNGQIGDYCRLRRLLESELSDQLYLHRTGTTDSELLFLLLVQFGLDQNPPQAIRQLIKFMQDCLNTIPNPTAFRMTAALTDGKRYYAIRYSSDPYPPTLYYSETNDSLIVMSEPLEGSDDHWQLVPPDTIMTLEENRKIKFQSII